MREGCAAPNLENEWMGGSADIVWETLYYSNWSSLVIFHCLAWNNTTGQMQPFAFFFLQGCRWYDYGVSKSFSFLNHT